MKKLLIVLCFSLFLIIGCVPKIVPRRSGSVRVQKDYAVLKTDSFEIAVKKEIWQGSPADLTTYFSTFYVIFRNRTKSPLSLNKKDFVLIDHNDEQYDAYSAKEVVKFLYSEQSVYNNLDYLFTFSEDSEEANKLKEEIDTKLEGIRNIRSRALDFRKIKSNARKSGIIFFEKFEPEPESKIKFYYKDNEITFSVIK